jgi:hypothetical protein
MLVVLAYAQDQMARQLVESWRPHGARLLTTRDLSAPGWRHYVGAPGEGWAVVEGERVPIWWIRGVLTRIFSVRELDVPHIVAEDRQYVAEEMSAFLLSWLSSAPFPVLNRPTASSLMGPSLSHERCLALAARAGLPLPNRGNRAPAPEPAARSVQITVVGQRCLGAVNPRLAELALTFVRRVEAELMTVSFHGPEGGEYFAGAELLADVSRPEVASALLDWFAHRGRA